MARNNPVVKAFLIIAVIVVVLITAAAISGLVSDDKIPSETTSESTPTTSTTSITTTQTTTQATTTKTTTIETAANISVVEQILKENFVGLAEISINETDKVINIIPTDSDLISDILAVYDGDSIAVEAWNGMVENMISMSKSMEALAPGYVLSISNPVNTDNTLLMVYKGYVTYDFSDN